MASKTAKKDEHTPPSGAVVVEWFEAVAFDPSRKVELLWLYETLKSLGVTQISQLEVMIQRAE